MSNTGTPKATGVRGKKVGIRIDITQSTQKHSTPLKHRKQAYIT